MNDLLALENRALGLLSTLPLQVRTNLTPGTFGILTRCEAGHMDPKGRYTGPAKNAMIEDGRGGGGRRAIEYGGGSVRSGQSSHSGGSHGRRRH